MSRFRTNSSYFLMNWSIAMDEDFIQPSTVGEITGLSVAALAQLRYQGTGPRFYKPTPKTVLYKRSEVIAWVEASAQTRTGSPAFA
jgi:predicted DNA-binding transcriptional regulator AlpA